MAGQIQLKHLGLTALRVDTRKELLAHKGTRGLAELGLQVHLTPDRERKRLNEFAVSITLDFRLTRQGEDDPAPPRLAEVEMVVHGLFTLPTPQTLAAIRKTHLPLCAPRVFTFGRQIMVETLQVMGIPLPTLPFDADWATVLEETAKGRATPPRGE